MRRLPATPHPTSAKEVAAIPKRGPRAPATAFPVANRRSRTPARVRPFRITSRQLLQWRPPPRLRTYRSAGQSQNAGLASPRGMGRRADLHAARRPAVTRERSVDMVQLPNESNAMSLPSAFLIQHIGALVRLAADAGGRQNDDLVAVSNEVMRLGAIVRARELRPKLSTAWWPRCEPRALSPRTVHSIDSSMFAIAPSASPPLNAA